MNTPVMNLSHQKAASTHFATLQLQTDSQPSVTLRTGWRRRVLTVRRGCAWVTLPGGPDEQARDLWLKAGETLRLAPFQTVWVDGWPQAELQLQPAIRLGLWSRLRAWAFSMTPARRQVRARAAAGSRCCNA